MHSKKFRTTTSVAAGTLLMLAAGTAWACTPQATIGVLPAVGIPGNVVTVEGGSFNPGPVEIRWNGEGGAILATGAGPKFSVQVSIPDEVNSGFYYVVAVQRGNLGSISGKAVDTLQVKSPGSAGATQVQSAGESGRVAEDLWSGFSPSQGQADSALSSASHRGAGRWFAAGLGLISAGAVLLMAFIVAPPLLRRKRAHT